MKVKAAPRSQSFSSIARFLAVALVFGIAYTQDPIYNSPDNQNTKFLQGLAKAGYGLLSEDWLANTIDPLPAFSFLVQFTYQYIHPEWMFYGYYILIFGVYAYSILGIVNHVYKIGYSGLKYWVFFTAFIALHTVHIKVGNFDTGWHFHAGVADQFILGQVFQPCNFGAFILLSIWLFLSRKPFLAVSSLALATTFHPTYLPSAAILTLSYMGVILKDEFNSRKALAVGVLSLILVLPVFCYMYFTFSATNPEIWRKAQEIIVEFRTPHHSLPEVWLDNEVPYIQAGIVALAVYLVRQTKLFLVLLLPGMMAIGLTVAEIQLNSDTLAFIAPWRLSVFLVPLSSCIIGAGLVSWAFENYRNPMIQHQRLVARVTLFILSVLVLAGAVEQAISFYGKDKTTPMMEFVKQTRVSGEIYLVPPDSKRLRKFRLYTGAPILVNFKSHPYKDREVIEWYSRLQLAQGFYGEGCRVLGELRDRYRITHVVLEREQFDWGCEGLEELFRDEHYGVYRVGAWLPSPY
ncbi:DUF6798 domain-containing protein [Coleofasciculus chthonoplastes]|uniref:DUF6798 domain-containing protein n=1 Tax=Coleofasciculus chthonoplastes TaxID=64178 RepID=UPI0032FF508E